MTSSHIQSHPYAHGHRHGHRLKRYRQTHRHTHRLRLRHRHGHTQTHTQTHAQTHTRTRTRCTSPRHGFAWAILHAPHLSLHGGSMVHPRPTLSPSPDSSNRGRFDIVNELGAGGALITRSRHRSHITACLRALHGFLSRPGQVSVTQRCSPPPSRRTPHMCSASSAPRAPMHSPCPIHLNHPSPCTHVICECAGWVLGAFLRPVVVLHNSCGSTVFRRPPTPPPSHCPV